MTIINFEKFKIKGANLGEESCFPDIKNDDYIRAKITVKDEVSDEEKKYIGKGMIPTLLPYKIQNGYNRERIDLELDAVILENEYLKATFVTELGGRLWSLYDKKAGRELLYANDVFQPGNLALRNAWFSGGVEWNMGIKGHNPLTCSPLFAEELTDKDGEPMLRMYEMERIREAVYIITAKLEKDVLLINVTLENTSDEDKYMYWWSNIAVDETPDTRVIVPTKKTFLCAYEEGAYYLGNGEIPVCDGVDVTYSTNLTRSRDFFYKIPDSEKKWITAVDGEGYGLIHMSTDRLHGRKLFAWGQGQGGKHWNNWLSDSKKSYIEIQAGLMKTQMEHFIMKAHTKITWTEGYGAVSADPEKAHSKDFDVAISEIKEKIKDKQRIVENASFEIPEKGKIRYMGSGWGAIENLIRKAPVSDIVDFPAESIGEEEKEWFELLENGTFIVPDKNMPIKSYVKGEIWAEKLENVADSWYKYYQLGVIYYELGKVTEAYNAFLKSNELLPNCWSFRNLSQLEKNEYENLEKAEEYIKKAVEEKDDYQPLWVDFAIIMIAQNKFKAWIDAYENLNTTLKNNGRLKMLYALCLVNAGRPSEALSVITDNFVMPDIKEGEFSVSHIWLNIHRAFMKEEGIDNPTDKEIYEKYSLPYELDYRMH